MERILSKLTSRKFWVSIVAFVTLVLTAKGMPESEVAQIGAIIMAGATVIAYVIGEGLVDAAEVKNTIYIDEPEGDDPSDDIHQ